MMEQYNHHIIQVSKAVISLQQESGETLYLLLLRKKDHRYDLPGGKVEHGDTVEQTLAKELHEETGLKVSLDQLPRYYHAMKIHDGARAMVFYIHHVIVEHEFPLVELHHEDHEIRIWLTQQEIVQIFSQDSYAFLDSVLLSLFTLWKQQKTQH